MEELTDNECHALNYEWPFWARKQQLPPQGDWRVWLCMAGRGWGKTRVGVEWIRAQVESGQRGRLAIVASTSFDVRHTCVEGESGILETAPPWNRPQYHPAKSELRWDNGAMATIYSAEEPDRLRGPQHDGFWADEIASWKYPEAWDQLMFGLRLGTDPRGVATTTPKPVRILRELLGLDSTHVTRGSSYDNEPNLPAAFFEQIIARYKGTRLGRQEIEGELLEESEGALWSREQIESTRIQELPESRRTVVAIDPASTSKETSDETGIIVALLGENKEGYLAKDLSGRFTPDGWAKIAINAYHEYSADRIIAESNQGGEMIQAVIGNHDRTISVKLIHAAQGKRVRAEPVHQLYELKRVHHVGYFPDLEDQMCTWEPLGGQKSPDRLDALVYALTELMPGKGISWGDLYG